jgi:NUMOD3 motif/Putative endonuclease segE, GIY-YIG domain
MEKLFNFVYITTNLITGKQYIGDHSTNDLDSTKTRRYLGSGNYLYHALNEYGKENFKREILEFFPTKQEAFDAQEKYIIQHNTLVPNGYNISPKGGMNVKGCCSEETKEKIRNGNKGKKHSDKTKELWSKQRSGKNNGMYGKGYLIKEEKNGMFNKHHSKKSKEKMSLHKKGKRSPMKGKSLSVETKEKISISKNKLSNTNKIEIYQFIVSRPDKSSIEFAIKPMMIKFQVSRNTIYRAYNYISSSSVS